MQTTELVLTEQQQIAADSLIEYIYSKNPSYTSYLLSGWAGTGKSTVISQVVNTCKESGYKGKFGMTATTNKAVRVLRETNQNPKLFQFGTIHSFCGLIQDIKYNGDVVYKPDYNSQKEIKIRRIQVLIVDEVSMLNKELFEVLMDYQRKFGFKIIFVGDNEQAPPINEAIAMPFLTEIQQAHSIGIVELTEIMRQAADNPIINYATKVRTDKVVTPADFSVSKEGVERIPVGPMNELLKQYFDTPEFASNPNYVKALAYRNVVVNRLNTVIREIVYKRTDLPKIIVGDSLIADKPVMVFDTMIGNWAVAIAANEEIKVLEVAMDDHDYALTYSAYITVKRSFYTEEEVMDYGFHKLNAVSKAKVEKHDFSIPLELEFDEWRVHEQSFRTYKLSVGFIDMTGLYSTMFIDVLHESSEEDFNSALASLKASALKTKEAKSRASIWRQYYEIQNHFAWVKYNYALTVHKSQGSTYTNCILHEWDIDLNHNPKEKKALKYVGITRARNKLYIVNNF